MLRLVLQRGLLRGVLGHEIGHPPVYSQRDKTQSVCWGRGFQIPPYVL